MLSIIDSTEVVDWPTVKEVAKALDYTEEHVRRLIRTRKLSAVKLRQWRINPDSLDDFVRDRTLEALEAMEG